MENKLVIIIFSVIFVVLFIGNLTIVQASDISKVNVLFLQGDYKSAIIEGGKILASKEESAHADELYYLLGLSYLKDGNYLRAYDIFKIIIEEFKNSPFKDKAKLGLGDTYLLRSQYLEAQKHYQELINNSPRTNLEPLIYYRLSQCAIKLGNTQAAKEYLDKIKQNFPLNLEAKIDKNLYSFSDIYYTVQVGSFSGRQNADNLTQKLTQKGYNAYIEDTRAQGKIIYRVRVGKVRLRQEAEELESKLIQEGYSTKIYP